MRLSRRPRSAAFTLIELLVVLAIITLLIGILLPALGEARNAARLIIDGNNQRSMSVAGQTYSSSFQDRMFAFTWTRNTVGVKEMLDYPDLAGPFSDDVAAAAAQAVAIMRKRSGNGATQMPRITSWIPHILYSHLVLQDFAEVQLPDRSIVNPADKNRLLWQTDPAKFRELFPAPADPGDPNGWRWAYSSSYEISPYTFNPDFGRARPSAGKPALPTVAQTSAWNEYSIITPGTTGEQAWLGRRKLADVSYPSQKALLWDSFARHRKTPQFYMYPDSKGPLAFFDGSVRTKTVGDATPGWRPDLPNRTQTTVVAYATDPRGFWPNPKYSANDQLTARIRWTRGGLRGIDFDGTELDTSNF